MTPDCMLTPEQVIRASELLRQLRDLLEWKKTAADYRVAGVTLRPHEARNSNFDVILARGKSGIGPIASLGFPEDLEGCLTDALGAYLERNVREVHDELMRLGVDAREYKEPEPVGEGA